MPVRAAFAFLVRSLSVHSYTPMMRVPAFDASAVRRSRSASFWSGLKVKNSGSSKTGARLTRTIVTIE